MNIKCAETVETYEHIVWYKLLWWTIVLSMHAITTDNTVCLVIYTISWVQPRPLLVDNARWTALRLFIYGMHPSNGPYKGALRHAEPTGASVCSAISRDTFNRTWYSSHELMLESSAVSHHCNRVVYSDENVDILRIARLRKVQNVAIFWFVLVLSPNYTFFWGEDIPVSAPMISQSTEP